MKAVGKHKKAKLGCIPQTMEKYISFSVDNLLFLDSAQFLPAPLSKLVENLAAEGTDKFRHVQTWVNQRYLVIPPEKIYLLLRKSSYPYEYMSSPMRFQETSLPPRENYKHVQAVWDNLR